MLQVFLGKEKSISLFLLNGDVMEITVFVFFDISNDRIRNRVGERCKDYGLSRIQYSGFMGRLTKNKREELYLKILKEIGEEENASVLIQPVCEKCFENALVIGKISPEPEIEEREEEKIENLWSLPLNYKLTEDE